MKLILNPYVTVDDIYSNYSEVCEYIPYYTYTSNTNYKRSPSIKIVEELIKKKFVQVKTPEETIKLIKLIEDCLD